jgi:hypothetical protein
MAGLVPATQQRASARAMAFSATVDTVALGGRLKGGDDDWKSVATHRHRVDDRAAPR